MLLFTLLLLKNLSLCGKVDFDVIENINIQFELYLSAHSGFQASGDLDKQCMSLWDFNDMVFTQYFGNLKR